VGLSVRLKSLGLGQVCLWRTPSNFLQSHTGTYAWLKVTTNLILGRLFKATRIDHKEI